MHSRCPAPPQAIQQGAPAESAHSFSPVSNPYATLQQSSHAITTTGAPSCIASTHKLQVQSVPRLP